MADTQDKKREAGARGARGAGRRLVIGLLACAGALALVVQAAPIVRAELGLLAVADTQSRLRQQQRVARADLATLAGVLRDSYGYRADPARAQQLGLVELLRAEAADGEADRGRLAEAEDWLTRGLAARPAAPHAWTRLARVRFQQDAPRKTVREAWVLAVTTGPGVRRLTVPRLEIGLRLWADLSSYERGLVRRQAALAFGHDPEATVAVAASAGQAGVVRAQLTSIAAQARFDRLLADTES